MSCPVWDLPQDMRDYFELPTLCEDMRCEVCTADPGEMPWIPPEGGWEVIGTGRCSEWRRALRRRRT